MKIQSINLIKKQLESLIINVKPLEEVNQETYPNLKKIEIVIVIKKV